MNNRKPLPNLGVAAYGVAVFLVKGRY